MKESTFEGVGGLKIFYRSWQPEGRTRGVVVIVHGLNSHGGQYVWVGEQFAAKDLAAYALDLRGRGRSEGERYYVEKMEDYTDDVATLVRIAKSENPGLPVFVLGHSVGGVISCVYTLDHQSEIDGLICESFAYDLPVPEIALLFLKGLSYITPHTHVFSLNNEDFSRDPLFVASMNNDPLIKGESQPAQTAKVIIDAASRLNREFPLIKLPVLILHGTADKATNPGGSQFFYDNTGSTDKTLKLYEGHYHDLLNDVGKEVVMADINDWIAARVPVSDKRKGHMKNERSIMKIVVIGGTGLIGSKVVAKLGEQGYEVVAASPNTGVNTLTGEGLAEALEGASVVVDVSNSPSFADAAVMQFFTTSTRNLLTYGAAAGVRHHVALSIVGTDRLPDSGYLRAKAAQEKLIKESSIPYSIVRATQFFEFVNRIADDATDGNTVRLPPVGFQPMAADDVASAVARVAVASPLNGIVEVAGPEQFRFDELIRLGLSARKDTREVIADPHARYFGTELGERSLVPGEDAQLGETRFEDWLSRYASQRPPTNPQPTAVASASKGIGGPQR